MNDQKLTPWEQAMGAMREDEAMKERRTEREKIREDNEVSGTPEPRNRKNKTNEGYSTNETAQKVSPSHATPEFGF